MSPGCSSHVEEACKAGSAKDCLSLSIPPLVKCGAGFRNDRSTWLSECDQALAFATLTCAAANTDPHTHEVGCSSQKALLEMHRQSLQQTAEKRCSDQSMSVCEAACQGGDMDGCTELGQMYIEGKRVPRDLKKGGALLRAACEKGKLRACAIHGAFAQSVDPQGAGASFAIACDGDEPAWNTSSCIFLMRLLDAGTYKPPAAERIALLRRVCARESTNAIGRVGACGRLKDLAETH
jgi:TPR repeat protein